MFHDIISKVVNLYNKTSEGKTNKYSNFENTIFVFCGQHFTEYIQ